MKKSYKNTTILVAAAGMATRIGSQELPKALVRFNGRPLIDWATCAFTPYIKKMQIVIRRETLPEFSTYYDNFESQGIHFVYQNEPLGTAYAVRDGLLNLDSEWVLTVWGDHIGASRVRTPEIFSIAESIEADFYLPMVLRTNPYVYFEVDKAESMLKFFETNSGAPKIREGYSDCGFFLFKKGIVLEFLEKHLSDRPKESKIEVNFLSLFSEMQKSGIDFSLIILEDEILSLGVNTVEEMKNNEGKFKQEKLDGQ